MNFYLHKSHNNLNLCLICIVYRFFFSVSQFLIAEFMFYRLIISCVDHCIQQSGASENVANAIQFLSGNERLLILKQIYIVGKQDIIFTEFPDTFARYQQRKICLTIMRKPFQYCQQQKTEQCISNLPFSTFYFGFNLSDIGVEII